MRDFFLRDSNYSFKHTERSKEQPETSRFDLDPVALIVVIDTGGINVALIWFIKRGQERMISDTPESHEAS